VLIDEQLRAAGWRLCNVRELDLINYPDTAVREVRMKAGHGQVDYLLYVDRSIVGVIEAKPGGTSLSGVEWQSAMYANGLSAQQQMQAVAVEGRLPFVFEASGSETHFTNGYDPEPRARAVYAFPRPETLARIVRDVQADAGVPTWRPPSLPSRGSPCRRKAWRQRRPALA
jgi:type I restriction enzyme R subunit